MDYFSIGIGVIAGLGIGVALGTAFFVFKFAAKVAQSGYLAEENEKLNAKLSDRQGAYELLLKENSHLQSQKAALEQAKEAMTHEFKALSQDIMNASLENSSKQLLNMASERFKQFEQAQSGDMDKRKASIEEMVKPITKQLELLSSSLEQVKGTDTALKDELKALQSETAKIAGAMRNPATRGQWGEYILERLLEKSGLIKDVHFQTQASIESERGRLRPDILIHLQDGLKIVIDSKAPVQDVLEDMEDGAKREQVAAKMAQQLRAHIRDLSSKSYQENYDSPDFVVLFLPAENLFSMAVGADPSLIDFAAEKNIVLASPILIMSILRVVRMSWQQNELAENAKDIAEAGKVMHDRLNVFTEHLAKLGKHMQTAIGSYNSAVGSFERNVMPQARRFESLHAAGGKSLSEPEVIEKQARELTYEPSETEEKDKDADAA